MIDRTPSSESMPALGWSAGVVRVFLESKLSILFLMGSLLMGLGALLVTPREEDPQIVVPVVDVHVAMPGATSQEVERLVATPLESILSEIHGVENIYSMSFPGGCLVTVRFYVGEDREASLTKVFTNLEANRHRVPPGVPGWQVVPVDIDDVPIVTIAVYSKVHDDEALREIAHEILQDLRALPDIGKSYLAGGRRREVRLVLDPGRLAGFGLSPGETVRAITGASAALPAGEIVADGTVLPVRAGPFLRTSDELARVVVGVRRDAMGVARPVHVGDIGVIEEGPEEPITYTRIGFGPGAVRGEGLPEGLDPANEYASVTIALGKHKGSNAVSVARSIEERLHAIEGIIIPEGVHFKVTRDYGETADHKVNELVRHLLVAVITVVVLLGLALGWREAIVVALAVPMTLSVTLFAGLMAGYTINRVTLFALILSLGLLVDDPIVDVENISRHFRLRLHPPKIATLVAVDEIRPPTILATFTVIVAFLPMYFITGMMGEYMGPMAFIVPVAMITSLIVAFTVTPWAAYHALAAERGASTTAHDIQRSIVYRWYGRMLRPMLRSRSKATAFLTGIVLLFLAALLLVPLGLVPVKMLPFDNKNELLLVVDAPEGSPLEATDALLADLGTYLRTVPEVDSYQTYAGLPAPIDFNGLVRHYFLRRGGHVGDIRVNLLPKEDRSWQAHGLALRLRPPIEQIALRHGALVKIVETPPGPPVLSTLAVEVRGPIDGTYAELVDVAASVRERLESAEGVVDVDWTIEAEHDRLDVIIDREKAALHGIPVEAATATVRLGLAGAAVGSLRAGSDRESVPIIVRLPREARADLSSVLSLRLRGEDGGLVPVGEIARVVRIAEDVTIYHKDLRPVVYVTGEPFGPSPVDVLFAVDSSLREVLPPGYTISWRGEGEWKITTEVFRDLGLAFAAALVLIYILLVAQTGSLLIPGVIMLAIPLTLIGVFPGFFVLNVLFGASVGEAPNPIFFTAPAMIGLIALAGIVVRNSIILIDFVQILLERGRDLEEAIVEAGATRLRPILLTAGAALFGAWVIVLDPIFSGLAWAFIFGIFASTSFTLLVIPVVAARVLRGRALVGDDRDGAR